MALPRGKRTERGGRNTEGWREPDWTGWSQREAPPLSFSLSLLSFPRPTSRPTNDLQPRRRRRSKVFSRGDCKHRETLVERLFRLRLIGYGDAVWNMHAHRSWHSPRGGNLHKRGPRWWNEICAINRRSLLRVRVLLKIVSYIPLFCSLLLFR